MSSTDTPWQDTGIGSSNSSDVPWQDTGIESGISRQQICPGWIQESNLQTLQTCPDLIQESSPEFRKVGELSLLTGYLRKPLGIDLTEPRGIVFSDELSLQGRVIFMDEWSLTTSVYNDECL